MTKAQASDKLTLVCGDITRQRVDAIVNAANAALIGGGGVDGAIHRAGGPAIMAECGRIRAQSGGCPTGTAVVTTAGRLPAKAVLHTAGPVWHGGDRDEARLLAACYESCMELAGRNTYRSIAFPSISTGVYGYPIDEAAAIAMETVLGVLQRRPADFDEVRFVLFRSSDLEVYGRTLDAVA